MGSALKYLHKKLLIAIFAANIGSAFQHGYNTSVLNTPAKTIRAWLRENQKQTEEECAEFWEWFRVSFDIGATFGCLFVPYLANRFGRKIGLLLNNIIALLGIFFTFFARGMDSYRMLIVGRFITGINCGINGVLCPIFLSEISPNRLRGAIAGGTYCTTVVCSMFIARIVGDNNVLGNKDHWHFVFILPIIPIFIQLVILSFCPESPKYLHINIEEEEHAEEALSWYRNSWDVEDELNDMKEERALLKEEPKITLITLFEDSPLRDPLLIVLVIVGAKRLTGIDAIICHTSWLLGELNLGSFLPWMEFIRNVIKILVTASSICLLETCGRRKLVLISYVSIIVSTICLFTAHILHDYYNYKFHTYLFATAILLFNVMFSVGLAPAAYVIGPEIFGQTMRPLFVSVPFSVNWAIGALFKEYYIPVYNVIGTYVFPIFLFCEVCSFILIYRNFQEPANKSIVQIMRMYDKY